MKDRVSTCCDCKDKADVFVVYPNSYLSFCKKCLVKRLIQFDYFTPRREGHNPIIVPVEFIDIPQHSCWFPQIIIRFGVTDTMYGMCIEDYIEWQNNALSKVEMNIP